MTSKVSSRGQVVIPEPIREVSRLKEGDTLDVGYANGLIILRKRSPLTPKKIRSLLEAGRDLPPFTEKDEAEVQAVIKEDRSSRRK